MMGPESAGQYAGLKFVCQTARAPGHGSGDHQDDAGAALGGGLVSGSWVKGKEGDESGFNRAAASIHPSLLGKT